MNTLPMKEKFLVAVLIILNIQVLCSQTKLDTVVAKTGDGIFSMLRSAGIPPVKYYVDFLELNKEQIKGASELIVGKKYILPYAPDSFKNMGTLIDMFTKEELPIFNIELGQMKQKDSTLKNTVYYIIYDWSEIDTQEGKTVDDLMGDLANELLIRGSKVYLIPKIRAPLMNVGDEENMENSITELGDFTSVINKKYLKHKGSYQRVLVINGNREIKSGISVQLQHYAKSLDGKKLAENFRKIFKQRSKKIVKPNQGISSFKDDTNIYLAKNSIPSITQIYLKADSNAIQLRYSKSMLPRLLTQGILKDYSAVKASK